MQGILLIMAVVCLSAYILVFVTLYCAELFFKKEVSELFEFLLFIIYLAILSLLTLFVMR